MMVRLPLKRGSGLKLHTNAFSSDDLNLLIDALDKNFAIKATINKSSIKDPACAAQENFIHFKKTITFSRRYRFSPLAGVKDHMHPTLKGSMLYKLNTSAPPLANIFVLYKTKI